MDKSAPNNTRYSPFSGPGTLGDENQRQFIQLLDDICHRESFTRTGDAKEGLTLVTFLEAFDQVSDGLGLVAGGAYSDTNSK